MQYARPIIIICTVLCNGGYLHILIIINIFISNIRCKTYLYILSCQYYAESLRR